MLDSDDHPSTVSFWAHSVRRFEWYYRNNSACSTLWQYDHVTQQHSLKRRMIFLRAKILNCCFWVASRCWNRNMRVRNYKLKLKYKITSDQIWHWPWHGLIQLFFAHNWYYHWLICCKPMYEERDGLLKSCQTWFIYISEVELVVSNIAVFVLKHRKLVALKHKLVFLHQ